MPYKTLRILIGICSGSLIVAFIATIIAIYSTVVLNGVRIEQLRRTRNVYDVSEMQEQIRRLDESDQIQWIEIDRLKQSMEIKQQ